MNKFADLIQKINATIAVHMTLVVGTMWCFYAFVVISILPTFFPSYQNQILYVSNCFQLVLLPLIMVGQALMGKSSEQRAIDDHAMLMTEMSEIKEMHAELRTALTKSAETK